MLPGGHAGGSCTKHDGRVARCRAPRHALAARVLAVEVREDHRTCARFGAGQRVGRQVGVAAVPPGAVGYMRDGLGADRAELAQVVADARRRSTVGTVSASAAAPLEMKSATCQLVVLEPLQDRVELLEERLQLGRAAAWPPSSVSRSAGRPVFDAVISGSRLPKRSAQVGRQRAHVAQRRRAGRAATGRRSWTSGSVSLRERLQARERRLGLVEEGREDPERLGQRLAAGAAVASNVSLGVDDRGCAAGPRSAVSAPNTDAGVADQPRAPRCAWPSSTVSRSVPSSAKRGQVAERVVEVAGRGRRSPGEVLLPGRNALRVCGSSAWKISSSSTRRLTWRVGAASPPSGIVGRAAACPASARRRSRPAASSGAGSRARPWRSARTCGRARSSRPCGCGCAGSSVLRRAPCRPTRRRRARRPRAPSCVASGNATLNAVALRLERDRAAEATATGTAAGRSTTARRAPSSRIRPSEGACFCI